MEWFIIITLILMVVCLYLLLVSDTIEHLQMTSVAAEVLQNVGSIYNNKEMIVDKLTTQTVQCSGDCSANTVTGNTVKAKTDISANTMTAHQTVNTKGITTDNITTNQIKIGQWTLKTDSRGYLAMFKGDNLTAEDDGDKSAFFFLPNGDLWINRNSSRGFVADMLATKVGYDQNIGLRGHSGMLDNWAKRCGDGDRDRDIGVACTNNGIGQGPGTWQIARHRY